MGMYTEVVFGAALEIPKELMPVLKFMIDPHQSEQPVNYPFNQPRMKWLFLGQASHYFGVRETEPKLHIETNDYMLSSDPNKQTCYLSFRSNIKNYDEEIENFLTWIFPFITKGSGNRELFATVLYEDFEIPTLYFKLDQNYNPYLILNPWTPSYS